MKEKKQYFNKYEFIKAKNLSLVNPYEGIIAYQEYFNKYPNDYSAYAYYISLLINLNKLDEAERTLTFLEKIFFEDKVFYDNQNRSNALEYNILYCKLRLLAYQRKYNEFLMLYYNKMNIIPEIKKEICFYFQKQIGDIDLSRREPNTYLFRQIVEYHEEDFRDHIKKHLADYNDNDSNYSKNIFDYKFPIDKVIEEVKKYIPNDKKLCLGFIDNTYVFKYDGCGRDNNKLVDYFKVIVFDNTVNIITMCPSDECEYLPYIDLNYMKDKDDEIKIKKISQIDKFNMRYHRK